MEANIADSFKRKLCQYHFPVLIESRSVYADLVGDEFFLTLQPLTHKQNIVRLSVLYHCCHGKCSGELHSLVSPVMILTVKTDNVMYTETNHRHFLCIIIIIIARRKFHLVGFFQRMTTLGNRLPRGHFLDH